MTTRSRQLATHHIAKVIERLAGPDAVPREDQIDAVAAHYRREIPRSGGAGHWLG